ncbi:hemin uptake protein HemP [Lelliottia amnigena]|jgi:hemin uptake protein HemP|uniref:hemin uptake protein HemP n=1 Tax=Lelliottia amnigena TaxID=61646 RepID=UPI00192ABAB0|nr:hemin uptake protein HemP [Lelliottia amnigena]MBL5919956.1 hemin uptake protein HemP [Lelliottia amnigena]MCE9965339.1 hemin uptake protein HemP [Lelliottia amnigena]QXB22894.1 hemin uptake protein HemP [Lelliottia amnigena]QXZ18165.1 hemin uptake protein HemP [Lelliottia amnigena]
MSRTDNTATTLAKDCTQPKPTAPERRIDSKSLLGDEGRVIIEHDGQQYLLRQTHAGKLILTK